MERNEISKSSARLFWQRRNSLSWIWALCGGLSGKTGFQKCFFFFFAIWSNNTAWKDGLCFSLCYRVLNKIQVGSFWVFFNSLFPLSLDNVIFFFETTSLTFCSMLLHLYTPFPITRSQFIDWEFLEDQWLCKTPKPLFLGIPTPFNIQMDWFNEIIHVATELS